MPGLSQRISCAFRCLVAILVNGQIPEDIVQALVKSSAKTGPTPTPTPTTSGSSDTGTRAKPADRDDRAVQLLALFQRDGRLIDFFTEDIARYTDAQIGTAVREVHQNCQRVLERYVKLEPILGSPEGQSVTIQVGFDPAAIKVIGNIAGTPPFRGVLRHRGWRITQIRFPSLPEGAGGSVVAPAEVEIE